MQTKGNRAVVLVILIVAATTQAAAAEGAVPLAPAPWTGTSDSHSCSLPAGTLYCWVFFVAGAYCLRALFPLDLLPATRPVYQYLAGVCWGLY